MTNKKKPTADLLSLKRIFTLPEDPHSTLSQIEEEISRNLLGFLSAHIVTRDENPSLIEKRFQDTQIPEDPIYVSEQADFLMTQVVRDAVHTQSPRFIGHMTSAIPYFMLPLSKIMVALNQNVVKIETSKSLTPLERQVLAMLHRLVYNRDDLFYSQKAQSPECALGTFCSGGTIANVTALWVALQTLMPPNEDFGGVNEEGLIEAVKEYEYEGLAVLVSERGHYSFKKAAGLLGIGRKSLYAIPTDESHRVDLKELEKTILTLKANRQGIVCVVGIAGTTETGSIDPLDEMADLCAKHDLFFHVDAAWGGPTLFSNRHRGKLKGIERADSVTIDAHKQMFIPMGVGMVVFRDETHLKYIQHSAQYVIRHGSRDLGRYTLEGSRPAFAILVHSGLRVMGRKGYELLIDGGIDRAKRFAAMIEEDEEFELISKPELNLLTYRYVPSELNPNNAPQSQWPDLNQKLNRLTIRLQKRQREAGQSFVSRTMLTPKKYAGQAINVFRVVLANPLTQDEHLRDILAEQKSWGRELVNKL